MFKKKTVTGLAVGALLASAVSASAAVIDFTSSSTGLTGNILGTTWTATGIPVDPNNNQNYDGANPLTNSFGLALNKDGWGISDDEVSPSQSISIEFGKRVKITGFAFLDLFPLGTNGGGESGILTVAAGGSGSEELFFVPANSNGGYSEVLGLGLYATKVTFTVGKTNDTAGVADGALAALEVQPVPLPAAGFLLFGALGGLAALRRRRKPA